MVAGNAIIGALRGVLVLDTNDWTPAVTRARSDLGGLRGAFEQLGATLSDVTRKFRNTGAALTVGVTAPLAALAVTSNRTASGFEASMKRVEAALKGVTGKELKALSDQARDLAPKVGKGATEAADGIEALGLAGVSTADILGGALKASLDLAAAGATDLAPAASLVTDVMGQFKVQAKDLPTVVNDVVGALDASKFGFVDFQQALAQGGGVAASAGLDFRDFATAIAATSTQFSSGSDAGTSFKTYIQSLVPVSKDAEYAMKQLGIEFFDLKTGRMKPLAEQAEVLRKAFAGLSDKSKTEALKNIFGSDAARTAIGLMEKGRQGIADLQREINGGDVGAKIDKRLEGEAAATNRIAIAWESVKIAIGQAGLTELITNAKTAFAGFLEAIAGANPALLKVGVAIGAVVAAIGPLVAAFGVVVTFLLARLARTFGAIGWAISAVIEPIGTLGAALVQLVARVGISRGLSMLARSFLGLTGPIGWAIAAALLFKDQIVAALGQVWAVAKEVLGPPLSALFTQLGALVSGIAGGPIGAGFSALISLFKGLLDVAGTIVGGLVELLGMMLVAALQSVIQVISSVVSVVQAVVTTISALLKGDFAGAWTGVLGIIDSVCQGIIDIVGSILPGVGPYLQGVYDAAKAFLVDGFSNLAKANGILVSGIAGWFAATFPGIVSVAKSVYEGVKGWLVDKFGGLVKWIGDTAKWIGDQYAALKEKLGFGPSKPSAAPAAPPKAAPAPAPAATGTRTVDFTPPKTTKTRHPRGRDTKYDGENREQLRIQTQLEAARARGDKATEQRLQDQLALSKQIEAYQRTGLSLADARAAAERDLKEIQAARAEYAARQIASEQTSAALDAARISGDTDTERSLERQEEFRRRIERYLELTHDKVRAIALAEADQLKVDQARDKLRKQWLADDAQDRALRNAQTRGDSETDIRRMERDIAIRDRARALESEAQMTPEAAQAKAATEWDEQDKARVTGYWRATVKDGFRAALDGDLGGWFKNWWKERVAKGMEEALNSLGDLIARLFSKAGSNDNGGGGGILGAISSIFGSGGSGIKSALGGAKSSMSLMPGENDWLDKVLGTGDVLNLPGFANGGSFKVGGMSGVDRNLLSINGMPRAMVSANENISVHPAGTGNQPVVVQIVGEEGSTFSQRVAGISGATAGVTVQRVQRRAARSGRQRLA